MSPWRHGFFVGSANSARTNGANALRSEDSASRLTVVYAPRRGRRLSPLGDGAAPFGFAANRPLASLWQRCAGPCCGLMSAIGPLVDGGASPFGPFGPLADGSTLPFRPLVDGAATSFEPLVDGSTSPFRPLVDGSLGGAPCVGEGRAKLPTPFTSCSGRATRSLRDGRRWPFSPLVDGSLGGTP
jgi:hypothetical protein